MGVLFQNSIMAANEIDNDINPSLEDDANAVLGDVSDSSCTYPLGYLSRQPVYACNTCSDSAGAEVGGVCLACSYHCHEGHTLVELYTKRNFRCDCGTTRLKNTCKLEPNKQDNSNSYNQNFKGLYCTCHRPYPDPDDPVEDCMIQCVVCEDWLHGRHTGMGESGVPDESTYAEMICMTCVTRIPYLVYYSGLAVKTVQNVDEEASICNVGSKKEDSPDVDQEKGTTKTVCPMSTTKPEFPNTRSMFLPIKWRQQLCKCSNCDKVYDDTATKFLTDETDTVHHYESKAREKKGTLEQGMEALSQLDRVKQVEAIHSYNNMKENLMEYLSKFADNKKVVREDDIREFFEGMKKNKKFKGGPPPSCK